MKYINIKKILIVLSSGIIILSLSGCKIKDDSLDSKKETKEQEKVVENVDNSSIPQEKPSNITENNNSAVENTSETEVVAHFETLETNVDNLLEESNFDKVKNKTKDIAISGIDFVFYDKEINGVTFNELSDSAKDKVLSIVKRIDTKVEQKIPNYKENVKDKTGQSYQYIASKLQEGIEYTDGKLENKYGDKYVETKEKAAEIKEKVVDTSKEVYENAKEKTKDGWTKIKTWYEDKTDKR